MARCESGLLSKGFVVCRLVVKPVQQRPVSTGINHPLRQLASWEDNPHLEAYQFDESRYLKPPWAVVESGPRVNRFGLSFLLLPLPVRSLSSAVAAFVSHPRVRALLLFVSL